MRQPSAVDRAVLVVVSAAVSYVGLALYLGQGFDVGLGIVLLPFVLGPMILGAIALGEHGRSTNQKTAAPLRQKVILLVGLIALTLLAFLVLN